LRHLRKLFVLFVSDVLVQMECGFYFNWKRGRYEHKEQDAENHQHYDDYYYWQDDTAEHAFLSRLRMARRRWRSTASQKVSTNAVGKAGTDRGRAHCPLCVCEVAEAVELAEDAARARRVCVANVVHSMM
jgi:hypothetical protein